MHLCMHANNVMVIFVIKQISRAETITPSPIKFIAPFGLSINDPFNKKTGKSGLLKRSKGNVCIPKSMTSRCVYI